jgi:uncharacterized SAM-binding protein YcdF (DUF218 family)
MSDLIAGLLAPSTVLLSVAVIVSWRRRWRTALAAAATLWLLATPPVASLAIRAGEAFAVRRSIDSVQPADAVVVLSAGIRTPPAEQPGTVEHHDLDRVLAGASLIGADKAPLLLFTGGASGASEGKPSVGAELAQVALRLGVPAAAVDVTGPVTNTRQEATAVSERLAGCDPGIGRPIRIILVTAAIHQPRAAAAFERVGLQVDPFPVDFGTDAEQPFSAMSLLPSGAALARTEQAWRQALGRLAALLTG